MLPQALDKLCTAYPNDWESIANDMVSSIGEEYTRTRTPLIDIIYGYGLKFDQLDEDFGEGYRNLVHLEATLPQQATLSRHWLTRIGTPKLLGTFLLSVRPGPGCLMFEWAGMSVGVERDGHLHT